MFKSFIQKKLESYVKKYFASHPDVKLIVVTGSVGKTTTKSAIATVLSQAMRVGMDDSNHNTHMSAPLSILGIKYPDNIHNPLQWLRVFNAARKRIKHPATVDVIIQELGTDRIGEIAHFGTYLRPHLAVVTAVQPEHMEFFGSLNVVAKEELEVVNYSESGLINRDDIDGKYAELISNPNISTYGTTAAAEYRIEVSSADPLNGFTGSLIAPGLESPLAVETSVIGEHMLRAVAAAIAVGINLGMAPADVAQATSHIRSVKGRMNLLRGLNESYIIDDSYNSSPSAALAALQVLYSINTPSRIAILGDMNELGESSKDEHETLGALCDPNLLSWVITVGDMAGSYLAPAAKRRGCQVKVCKTAIEAGAFAHSVMTEGSVVLAKGSQGGIYLEEAVKILLHETHEEHELVRQSVQWRTVKDKHFSQFK